MLQQNLNNLWLSLSQFLFVQIGSLIATIASAHLKNSYQPEAFAVAHIFALGSSIISLSTSISVVSRFEKDRQYPLPSLFVIGFILSTVLVVCSYCCIAVGLAMIYPLYGAFIAVCVFIATLIGILEGFSLT